MEFCIKKKLFCLQAIVSAVRERIDETSACVMRSLLRMSNNLSQDKSLQTKSSPTVSLSPVTEYIHQAHWAPSLSVVQR